MKKKKFVFVIYKQIILEKYKKVFENRPVDFGKRLAILADFYARTDELIKAKDTFKIALRKNKKMKYQMSYLLLCLFGINIYKKIINLVIRLTQ